MDVSAQPRIAVETAVASHHGHAGHADGGAALVVHPRHAGHQPVHMERHARGVAPSARVLPATRLRRLPHELRPAFHRRLRTKGELPPPRVPGFSLAHAVAVSTLPPLPWGACRS